MLLVLFAFAAHSVRCQSNITVRGEVVGGVGKLVGLYRYSDMLTRSEVLLAQDTIGENSHFELHAYANYPTLMFLKIEFYSQSFFVEPGRDYEVYIPEFDWDISERKNVFLSPEALPVVFHDMPSDDLNGLITVFEAAVAEYIDSHSFYFDPRFRPQRRYFDSLEAEVERCSPDTKNEFFNRYKRYKLAELKYAFNFASRKSLAKRYVEDSPILYYDDSYMNFFFTLFAESVSKGSPKLPAWLVGYWVNNLQADVFLDSLGLNPLLRNEQVRELAALEALQEAFCDSRFYEPDKVVQMVELIGGKSKFPEHKRLAELLAASLRRQLVGVEVPSFVLPDVEKREVSFDSLKGKWIYLSFVRVGDPNCLSEIETMAFFKDSIYTHHPDVEFVTICCDREFQKMYHFLRNTKKGSRYNWTWLHFNGDYKLLEQYGVVSYPHFVLIMPDGSVPFSVTPTPASGFLLHPPWRPEVEEEEKPSFLR